jgi:hypothetical protein
MASAHIAIGMIKHRLTTARNSAGTTTMATNA